MQQRYGRHYRRERERKGRFAESLAALILSLKGYHILERRWKTPAGEVDIIASKGDVLVFVEVKARKAHDEAVQAVTHQNRRRIEQAADLFVASRRLTPVPRYRFDIMTVVGVSWQHHRGAWLSGD